MNRILVPLLVAALLGLLPACNDTGHSHDQPGASEVCAGRRVRRRRLEPRPKWPHGPRRRSSDGDKIRLAVSYVESRKHLPVIELRRAA